ncbi:uroporphyrinogen-III synthase [Halobacillus sp. Marseille-P3879]|uniref:uroporphyrinogen-III synthase n=1 Tax=Halobacillus sp. Marseille-P3879 TaxID=2045014 RepID=UPI0013576B2A|nr:uroporphyrinogen-III synthase [Halobacillus sp. Marseille-P3879]
MTALTGKSIAIAADRQAAAIGELVHKQGGTPVTVPIQGRKVLNEREAEKDVKKLIGSHFDYVILTTGIGSKALEEAATRIGEHEAYIESLRETKLAVRGSKTIKWLKEKDLKPFIVSEDGTMKELIGALSDLQLNGEKVFLQQYNKEEERLLNQLTALPIELYQSLPYHYIEPEEETLHKLQNLIIDQKVDAVVFTSKTQVQNLFETGSRQLSGAFADKVLAVAVGSVTADELKSYGIHRIVEPAKPKMGAMIIALTNYYKQQA